MELAKFDDIEEAFRFVVERLIPKRHAYIVNVRGPREIAKNYATTVQVVAEDMIYRNGAVGLTIHLPFDPASGMFQHLAEFVGTDLNDLCDEYKLGDIPCFALRVGTNLLMTEKALRFILQNVYGYSNLADFEFEVHDEGRVERETS